jgi:hypothetical protein
MVCRFSRPGRIISRSLETAFRARAATKVPDLASFRIYLRQRKIGKRMVAKDRLAFTPP